MKKCLILVLSLFLFSCTNFLFEKKVEFNGAWAFAEPFVAVMDISHSTNPTVSSTLHLTYNEDYPFENIYLKNLIYTSNDTLVNDVVSFDLQDDLGMWIGNKKGDKYTIELPLPQSYKYPITEGFTFRIQQYTREDALKGIDAVMLTIQ